MQNGRWLRNLEPRISEPTRLKDKLDWFEQLFSLVKVKDMSNKMKALNLQNTENLWTETVKVIPGGTQTFSKAPFQHVNGVSPKLLVRGKGCRVWDADDNEYIDYMMGLGPAILGHADQDVNRAVAKAMEQGISISLPHPMEAELARLLIEIIPCAEMVRFGKNGSDVTAGAVRAARGITGRDKIVCCGYHGWQDWYIGSTWRYLGVPSAVRELTLKFEYNDLNTLEKIFKENADEIAAVIMEPVSFHAPRDGFLEKVKKLVQSNGALLIFDEIITGFRMALGGAQEYYGITPDLACFGKAMGNGMPIAAVVGKAQYMKIFNDIFFSFTFGGELASIAGALATLNIMRERGTLAHIHAMGHRLIEGLNQIVTRHGAKELLDIIGFEFWPEYVFKPLNSFKPIEIQSLFQQEIVRRGVLTRAGMFVSAAHSEDDIDITLDVFDQALHIVKEAVEDGSVLAKLEGDVIQPVIRPPKIK